MIKADPPYIIAIGASAGGMEEINSFFDHTPVDGVSYVIVQHLSANHKSRMVELLGRHSKLVVTEAENGMPVKTNQVYLIPNDKFMTIKDNRLWITEKEMVKGPHLTINAFFNSLAGEFGKKAIAIILSGLGSDGTSGVKAIKKAGGMVIVRNPETTEFGSMPSNAIATGVVDFVLEPELMPGAIEDYIQHENQSSASNHDDEKYLGSIIALIRENSPLDFSDYKRTTILRRTKRRAQYNNIHTLAAYYDLLTTSPEEVDALSKDFLISVTSFFRDEEAFDFIRDDILPGILSKISPGEELKLWVAGCATGEEAFSLAMLIFEQLTGYNKDLVVKIFATDIDNAALAQAGKGIYNDTIKKNVTPERLERHFLKEGKNYRIKPNIRKMVIFAQHDLVKNPPYCNMHFISCRNLLIYMTPLLQKKIFNMLLFGLKTDGYLFLGSSENPMPIINHLQPVNKKWKIFRNTKIGRALSFDTFSMPELSDIKRTPRLSHQDADFTVKSKLAEAVNLNLTNELNCLVICVDEKNTVIKSYGDTEKYLIQKHFSSDLTELLPKPLQVAFKTAVNDVLKTKEKVMVKGIKIKLKDTVTKVNLLVSPLLKPDDHTRFIVIFSEDGLPGADRQEGNDLYDESIYLNKYTVNLEDELKDLKVQLELAYEKLDASNENLQSFNEEIISANEEMQSTNEEMQSVNEELHTINTNYQLKNKELLEINDDLNNYFRSNINGQLFIDNDLRLMKFSPGTVKQINLQDTDIGRPLSNITTNIKFDTITEDIKQVLKDGNIITKEIETNDGKWYQVMTMPYLRQTDQKNNGAIITFNDVSELKKTQLELDKKNKSLVMINADLDNFVHAASHDLLNPLANIETSIDVMNRINLNDKKLSEFLKIINLSIKKFRGLVTDIGTIAKIEGDVLKTEMVDIDSIIDNIEWSLENKIKESGTTIIKNLDVRLIPFSKKNLRSIVYNLVSNGIMYRGEKPPVIRIATKNDGENIVLTVEDNGMGMTERGLAKIFEMYGRLNQDMEGQGIGLFLAKKIINAAGGRIEVQSEPSKGSKFTVFFKAEPEPTLVPAL
jgi:two-component system CheB/CheR fusion protein